MKATIWHNPRCSKSRAALALLEEARAEIEVVEYLKTPPTREVLAALYARAGMTAGEGLRTSEPEAKLLKNASEEVILAAMAANPILIQRPLIETARGVCLARPAERLLDIL